MKRFIVLAALLATPAFAQQPDPLVADFNAARAAMIYGDGQAIKAVNAIIAAKDDAMAKLAAVTKERDEDAAALKKERDDAKSKLDKAVADLAAITKERDELKAALEKANEAKSP